MLRLARCSPAIFSFYKEIIRRYSSFLIQNNFFYINHKYNANKFIKLIFFYRYAHNEKILRKYLNRILKYPCSHYILFGLTMFSWENNGISDTEFLKKIESANLISHTTSKYNKKSNSLEKKNLESVYEDDQICIYKEYTDNGKYKYLVKGTFNDITAWAFYQSQIDIEYRKKWDKYLLAADKLEQNTQQDSDIIHWIMQFPYPMYDREYVYIRRHKYDKDKNVIVIMSRAVNYPIQDDKNYVRVTEYTSNLVIKPHDAIDKNGFDFELEYYDDPQSFFSNSLYNWVSKTSIIEFIQRLHEAAKDYHPISLNEDNKVGTSFEVVQRNTTDLPNTIATNKVMSNSRVEMMEKSFENVKEKPRNIASN